MNAKQRRKFVREYKERALLFRTLARMHGEDWNHWSDRDIAVELHRGDTLMNELEDIYLGKKYDYGTTQEPR